MNTVLDPVHGIVSDPVEQAEMEWQATKLPTNVLIAELQNRGLFQTPPLSACSDDICEAEAKGYCKYCGKISKKGE